MSSLLGIKEFLPYDEFYTKMGLEYCSDGSKFQPICSEFLFLIAGRSVDQHNAVSKIIFHIFLVVRLRSKRVRVNRNLRVREWLFFISLHR